MKQNGHQNEQEKNKKNKYLPGFQKLNDINIVQGIRSYKILVVAFGIILKLLVGGT